MAFADYAYDAAGNRTGSGYAYDGLNRMTSAPKAGGGSHAYQHDAVGNRTWRDYGLSTVAKYSWDELGRMRAFQGSEAAAPLYGFTARYRPDGLRAQKVNGLQLGANYTEENEVSGYYDIWATDKPTTRYYYEGQMPFGEDYTYSDAQGVHQRTTVYVPGHRGADSIRVTLDGNLEAEGWPIYDTHGNNVGMFKQENDNFSSVNHERRYDAWGAAVWQTGDPPMQGYVASIGHREDPESDLVYMRARYYEPSTGRFISEDPAYDGANWFAYCGNDPVNRVDSSGQYWETWVDGLHFLFHDDGGGHLHVYDGQVELVSRRANGSAWHKEGGEWSEKIIKAIVKAARSGQGNAKQLARRLLAGGYGLSDDLIRLLRTGIGGIVIMAITSLDAYAQWDPADFADTLRIIGMSGKNY